MTRPPARLVALLLLVSAVVLRPAIARADGLTADAATREAAVHFDRGVALFDRGDWSSALLAFERAYALSPNFRVLYDIAECRYRLGDYAGALTGLEGYLTQGDTRVGAERRAVVEGAMATLRKRVARLRVSTEPAGAEIRVDGTAVGTTPLPSPLLVNAGLRKVSAERPGYVPATQYIDVAREAVVDVAFGLATLPPPAPPPVEPQRVPPERRPTWPAIALFGLGAAGVGLGAAFGIDALTEKSQLDRQCGGGACPSASQPLIDDSRKNAVLSTVGFALGVAGVGAGVAYLAIGGGGGRPPGGNVGIRAVFGLGSAWATATF